ncbi:MAG: hypothetical protein Q9162_007971, partial [Coniocarpon cinnabarinum]
PAPNPYKSVIILEELGLPYEYVIVDPGDVKKEPYVSECNPNGRVPTLKDPNTSPPITIWESSAINKYLAEQYDKAHRLHATSFPEKEEQDQWLFFQASGQGPYYGQAAWFNVLHHEPLPSAKTRYNNEAMRVMSVLNSVLATKSPDGSGKRWLVGGKVSIVDLAFFWWDKMMMEVLSMVKPEGYDPDNYPHFKSWHDTMGAMKSVQKSIELHKKNSEAWASQSEGNEAFDRAREYLKNQ